MLRRLTLRHVANVLSNYVKLLLAFVTQEEMAESFLKTEIQSVLLNKVIWEEEIIFSYIFLEKNHCEVPFFKHLFPRLLNTQLGVYFGLRFMRQFGEACENVDD